MLNRLEVLRVFSTVAESESFKEAATRLAMSPQKITRAIQELEAITGESLFHRNTRSIQITEYGTKFHVEVKEVLASVNQLFAGQDPKVSDYSGTVRITVSHYLGRAYLMEILRPLLLKYPEIKFDILAADTLSDMVEQKIDIGIRGAMKLKNSQLVAKKVGRLGFKILGSPKLIRRLGEPKSIQDLNRLPTIQTINNSTGRPWPWNLNGEDFLPANSVFSSNEATIELQAAYLGVGFAQLGTLVAKPYIERGKLVEVMSDHTTDDWYLYVIRPEQKAVSKRVRLVFDHLVQELSKINFS